MTPVNQHAHLHTPRPPMREQCIQCGPGRSAREQHIVYQHDILVFNVESNFLFLHHRLGTQSGEVVPIERDVQCAYRHFGILNPSDDLTQPFGQRYAAAANSDQAQSGYPTVLFHNFVGEPHQCTFNFRCGHQLRFLVKSSLLRGSFCVH